MILAWKDRAADATRPRAAGCWLDEFGISKVGVELPAAWQGDPVAVKKGDHPRRFDAGPTSDDTRGSPSSGHCACFALGFKPVLHSSFDSQAKLLCSTGEPPAQGLWCLDGDSEQGKNGFASGGAPLDSDSSVSAAVERLRQQGSERLRASPPRTGASASAVYARSSASERTRKTHATSSLPAGSRALRVQQAQPDGSLLLEHKLTAPSFGEVVASASRDAGWQTATGTALGKALCYKGCNSTTRASWHSMHSNPKRVQSPDATHPW